MTWIWCQKLQIQIVLIISEISQIVSHWVPGSLPTTSGVMYPRSRITVQSISDVEVLRLEKVTARNLFNTLVMLRDDHLRFVIHYQSPSVASCKLTKQNWIQEAHGCHHGDSSVLQFHGSAALESGDITISGKSHGIPETDGCLDTKLVLKRSQGNLAVLNFPDAFLNMRHFSVVVLSYAMFFRRVLTLDAWFFLKKVLMLPFRSSFMPLKRCRCGFDFPAAGVPPFSWGWTCEDQEEDR